MEYNQILRLQGVDVTRNHFWRTEEAAVGVRSPRKAFASNGEMVQTPDISKYSPRHFDLLLALKVNRI
jgi:hypothetical protein